MCEKFKAIICSSIILPVPEEHNVDFRMISMMSLIVTILKPDGHVNYQKV